MKIHDLFRIGFKSGPSRTGTKHLTVELDVKTATLSEDGTFSGYGSVFGEIDSYKEIVAKGAFAKSLRKWKAKGKLPRLLWQHRSDKPIGVWTSMAEDDHGLKVTGQLSLDTDQGKEAYALLKMGAIDGLSIGYVATEWTENTKTGVITLVEIDLWEVSLVTFPAGPSARVDGVKSALERGTLPDMKEYEGFLREAGFSNSEAKVLASKGLPTLLRQREAESAQREIKLDDFLSFIENN